jgi:sugar/nucleoside kinase (ribokinase family)
VSPRFDVVVVGELNADVIVTGGWPEPGREVVADAGLLTLGSSGAIFAADCAGLGLSVAFCGLLGRDALGAFVHGELERAGVAPAGVRERDDVATGLTVSITGTGDRAMLTFPGAMAAFGADEVDWTTIAAARHLHVSSPYLQDALRPELPALLARARSLGLTTSLDPGWDPRERWLEVLPCLPHLDVFLPNEPEAAAIAGAASAEEALERLSGPLVAIKLGERGAVATGGVAAAAVPSDVVDATGAGDGFDAAFVWGWLGGRPLAHCLRLGCLAGARVAGAAGGTAGFPTAAELAAAL